MNRVAAVNWLLDFFTSSGVFSEAAGLHGMEGSEIISLFVSKFNELASDNKKEVAFCLKDAVLGNDKMLARYLPLATVLLGTLCISGEMIWFLPFKAELESEFCNEQNVNIWLECSEVKNLPFKKTWLYALQLNNALYVMGSECAKAVHQRLVSNARSGAFKRALMKTQEIGRFTFG